MLKLITQNKNSARHGKNHLKEKASVINLCNLQKFIFDKMTIVNPHQSQSIKIHSQLRRERKSKEKDRKNAGRRHTVIIKPLSKFAVPANTESLGGSSLIFKECS